MILLLQDDASKKLIDEIQERLQPLNLDSHLAEIFGGTVLVVSGDISQITTDHFGRLNGMPFRLVRKLCKMLSSLAFSNLDPGFVKPEPKPVLTNFDNSTLHCRERHS